MTYGLRLKIGGSLAFWRFVSLSPTVAAVLLYSGYANAILIPLEFDSVSSAACFCMHKEMHLVLVSITCFRFWLFYDFPERKHEFFNQFICPWQQRCNLLMSETKIFRIVGLPLLAFAHKRHKTSFIDDQNDCLC